MDTITLLASIIIFAGFVATIIIICKKVLKKKK